MSIYVRDAAGNRQKFAGVGLPGPPGADGKSAYQYAVEGGFTGTEADFAALVGVMSNPNLLDNGYLADPINQRGQEEYTGVGYTIDRWKIVDDNTKILIGNGYITIEKKGSGISQFLQYTEIPIALKDHIFTLSILDTNNVLTSTTQKPSNLIVVPTPFGALAVWAYNGDKIGVNIALDNADSMSIVAAKLELGPVQTLAHKEGDTWVLNGPPPNKALELAKCQRYQLMLKNGGRFSGSISSSGANGAFFVPTPVTMRTNPTIAVSNFVCVQSGNNYVVTDNVTAAVNSNGVDVSLPNPGLSARTTFTTYSNEDWILDANL